MPFTQKSKVCPKPYAGIFFLFIIVIMSDSFARFDNFF
jgi:hypothetical protein